MRVRGSRFTEAPYCALLESLSAFTLQSVNGRVQFALCGDAQTLLAGLNISTAKG